MRALLTILLLVSVGCFADKAPLEDLQCTSDAECGDRACVSGFCVVLSLADANDAPDLPDPMPDAQPDPEPEDVPDPEPDPMPDVQPDPEPADVPEDVDDPMPDADPEPDPMPDVQPDPEPEDVPDVPDPEPDPMPDAMPDADPEPFNPDVDDDGVVDVPIEVDTLEDELNADGDCSLREAIEATNLNVAVDACPAGYGDLRDVIELPAGLITIRIEGAGEDGNQTGDFDLLGELEIRGQGAALTLVDGNGLDRVFHNLAVRPAELNLAGLTVRGGSVDGDGGGVFVSEGVNTFITGCDIHGNSAVRGGGVAIVETFLGNLVLQSSAIRGNTSSEEGGGVFFEGGGFSAVSVTLSGNNGHKGAGVFVERGSANFVSATVASNTAVVEGGGLGVSQSSSFSLQGSLVTANMAPNGPNCFGRLFSGGRNLVSLHDQDDDMGDVCAVQFQGGPDNQDLDPGVDPMIGPLESNGGQTPTHALLEGSPCIDAGLCPPSFDQRGISRPQGAGCDVGAFERE